jgi:hypothetical protein
VEIRVRVANATGGRIAYAGSHVVAKFHDRPLSNEETETVTIESDGRPGWIRADVVGPDGKLWLIGNPIYLNSR